MTSSGLDQPKSEAELALDRLKKRRDLRSHLFAFLVINGAVWGLWAITGAGYPWPAWITGVWAIGVVFNVWDVYYGKKPITEADIRRETERLQSQH